MNELPCPTATSGGWAPSPSAQVAIPVSAAADFNDFKNNPSQYYVNIHTTCAMAGLIRGMVEDLPGVVGLGLTPYGPPGSFLTRR